MGGDVAVGVLDEDLVGGEPVGRTDEVADHYDRDPGLEQLGGDPLLVTATLTPLDSTTKSTVVPALCRSVRTVPGTTMPSSWKVLLPRAARLRDRLVGRLEEHDRRRDPLEDEEPDGGDYHEPDHASRGAGASARG